MITVTNVSLNFSGTPLFTDVDLKFMPGNCYGVIGANGAGKSTFLKVLSGELEPSSGSVNMPQNARLSVLKQDQFMYDEYSVIDTVIMGNAELYDITKEKEMLYAKEDFNDEDGMLAADLEYRFAELGGWEAESDALKLLLGLGLDDDILYKNMATLDGKQKVKVLLAQALFGNPEIILLDEPTNNLDYQSIKWLENTLMDYPGTVIVVSHDRHFLNNVCTHIVDIDFSKIKMYIGNYEFWYESSQLMQRMIKDQNKKKEEKAQELMAFIARFSANKSKSRQATSRKKLLEKLTIEELPASSRKYPYAGFKVGRELGRDILSVQGLSKTINGEKILDNVSFIVNKDEKIMFYSENEIRATTLFKILTGEIEPDAGVFKWGVSTVRAYYPKDNTEYFIAKKTNVLEWLQEYSTDKSDIYLRGFLGRMLFSGDDVFKNVDVLSGGEKARCMFSRMMMADANVLLLDQPTNHLDLESITAVNNGLINFKGVVLLSSHDQEFINTVVNRVIELKADGIVDKLGTFDDYINTNILL